MIILGPDSPTFGFPVPLASTDACSPRHDSEHMNDLQHAALAALESLLRLQVCKDAAAWLSGELLRAMLPAMVSTASRQGIQRKPWQVLAWPWL